MNDKTENQLRYGVELLAEDGQVVKAILNLKKDINELTNEQLMVLTRDKKILSKRQLEEWEVNF